jgi:hypothetical protein
MHNVMIPLLLYFYCLKIPLHSIYSTLLPLPEPQDTAMLFLTCIILLSVDCHSLITVCLPFRLVFSISNIHVLLCLTAFLFSLLNNNLLYRYPTVDLSIFWRLYWWFPVWINYQQSYYKHFCAGFELDFNFQLG